MLEVKSKMHETAYYFLVNNMGICEGGHAKQDNNCFQFSYLCNATSMRNCFYIYPRNTIDF